MECIIAGFVSRCRGRGPPCYKSFDRYTPPRLDFPTGRVDVAAQDRVERKQAMVIVSDPNRTGQGCK